MAETSDSGGGRKLWVTAAGMALVTVFGVLPSGFPNAGGAVTAITSMVLAFCGANAAVSWAYSKHEAQSEATTHIINEKRDHVEGYEPTP